MSDKSNFRDIGLGVAGFGGFAMFAVQHFMQIKGVRLLGIAETHRQASFKAAQRFNAKHYDKLEELVKDPEINLVYIATPPFLHYSQSLIALNSGKNVICEKPLALNMKQADEMLLVAKKNKLLLTVNLMQRYNPVYDAVKKLIEKKLLGELLHCYFENYASDEGLTPEHWFWDKRKSGGIFVEHGVHFFDMFEGWIGKGKVEAAQSIIRPNTKIEEQVNCTVRYKDVLVNFYHGFHQASRMDRQELRLLFERGDVSLYEWIPTRVSINALADEKNTKLIMEIFPDAKLQITEYYSSEYRKCTARHKKIDIYQKIFISHGDEDKKMHIYGDLVKAMFKDQTDWIKNKNHKRKITESNGYSSLQYAVEATRLANK